MNRILRRMLLLCLALMFAVPGVYAEGTATDLSVETIPPMEAAPVQDEEPMAEDITRECLLNGSTKMKQLWDGRHMTFWESTPKTGGVHRLIITPPEGKAIGGVSIRWRSHPVPVKVQVAQGEDWRTVAETDGLMYSEYIPLDGLTCEIRVVGRESEKTQLRIDEVRVVTPGRLPEDLQVWQLPGAKVDMILLSAHPDDEVLWFGGMIPTYAAEQKKDVLVVCAATWHYNRRQELLDSLWTMGVRIHPVFLGLEDVIGSYADKVFEAWNKEQVLDRIAGLYRTYQPDVVVLHDVNGEYGHGVHKAISRAGREALDLAADPEYTPEGTESLRPWNVPKAYVHLWAENQIQLDWHKPLAAFNGMTAQDVARLGFECHESQHADSWQRWRVEDGGEWDNSLFGLYRTSVGVDEMKNDLFEHID